MTLATAGIGPPPILHARFPVDPRLHIRTAAFILFFFAKRGRPCHARVRAKSQKMSQTSCADTVNDAADDNNATKSRQCTKKLSFWQRTPGGNGTGIRWRHALIVGIDYMSVPGLTLGGCVNDAVLMRDFLRTHYSSIRMCVDRDVLPTATGGLPTRANILQGIAWLFENASAGDRLFWHYSGHGAHVPDVNGDEADCRDECLVPLDVRRVGYILDDALNALVIRGVRPGVTLHILFDCCHSGTALDLPHVLRYGLDLNTGARTKTVRKPPRVTVQAPTPGRVVLFAACSDAQYAKEVPPDAAGRPHGAMTRAFVDAFRHTPTYGVALRMLRDRVRRYGQSVQISSNLPIDPHAKFMV